MKTSCLRYFQGDGTFFNKSKIFVWAFDSDASVAAFDEGRIMSVFFLDPARMSKNERLRTILSRQGINEIWKKNRADKHIVGHVEAVVTDEKIIVEKMAVRKNHRRKGINSSMIELLKMINPKIAFKDPTREGNEFIKGCCANAEVVLYDKMQG